MSERRNLDAAPAPGKRYKTEKELVRGRKKPRDRNREGLYLKQTTK